MTLRSLRCLPGLALLLAFLTAPAASLSAGAGPNATGGHGDWPFVPPSRPPVPKVDANRWCRNPIDYFVLQKLEEAGLSPNRRADKLSLLRRVTFDLTGLPPTCEQQQAFLNDDSTDAYSNVVDRLLESPHYGERWAQHWLDVVRFAETEGFKADSLRPNAYRYRDYVIRSLNADRPYDEFVRQQIAGDELEPDNTDALIATGLNRLYPDENNAANLFQRRDEILNDVTQTTSLAIMALTMGCAQCHDHKFDDISQQEYFQLRAFFAPLVERDDLAGATAEQKREYDRQQDVWLESTATIRREMDALLVEERKKSDDYHLQKFRPEIQQCVHTSKEERTPLEQQIAQMALKQLAWRFNPDSAVKKLPESDRDRYMELKEQLATFDHLKPDPLPVVMAISDVGPESPPTFLLAGGNWKSPEKPVPPGFPSLLGEARLELQATAQSTGRRAALARWLTRKDHPLTARVMVNRLWHHHFGRGIVPTPNDFGIMGAPPSHPGLLDWLAMELMENRWSLKHIHRLMVTSATYRQSSIVDPNDPHHAQALRVDGNNQWLWHARRRRLEGEAIRDAMLQISGQLNPAMFGPSSRPPLPNGVSKRYAWKPDPDLSNHRRRSIYVFVKRNMRFPLFDAFDLPDLHNSCGSRTTTTTAPQALLMLNSELTADVAQRWAERLVASCGDDTQRLVSQAYSAAFGRPATERELVMSGQFLSGRFPTQSNPLTKHDERLPAVKDDGAVREDAVAEFCHALFNANEFLFVD